LAQNSSLASSRGSVLEDGYFFKAEEDASKAAGDKIKYALGLQD